MPTKKIKEDAPVVVEEVNESPTPNNCGHINRHSIGLDRKPDNVACDKPKGHNGDHEGEHEEYIKFYETTIENGVEITRVKLVAEKRRVQWGDMAGIPFDKIPRPAPLPPPTLSNLAERMARLENTRGNGS